MILRRSPHRSDPDNPIRQSAIQNLLSLGDEQIRTGFPEADLLQIDRVLPLTSKANSPAVTRTTLGFLMSRPSLWSNSITPQRTDRLQRLNPLSRLANQVTEAPFQAGLLIDIARGYESANAMPHVNDYNG